MDANPRVPMDAPTDDHDDELIIDDDDDEEEEDEVSSYLNGTQTPATDKMTTGLKLRFDSHQVHVAGASPMSQDPSAATSRESSLLKDEAMSEDSRDHDVDVDEEDNKTVTLDANGAPGRQSRKTKPRGKGFTPRRRSTGDAKGAWKPRKKSLHTILSKLITAFKNKDHYGFFLDPVDLSVVTDYMKVISEPMDLGTMDKKVRERAYREIAEFKNDFRLVVTNAKTYNPPGSVYYKSAERLEVYGNRLIDREEPNVAVELEQPNPHLGNLASTKDLSKDGKRERKSHKRVKKTELIEGKMRASLHPNGTAIRSAQPDADAAPLPKPLSPFDDYVGGHLSQRQHSWAPIRSLQCPRGAHDYGPYQYHDPPPPRLNACLIRNVYGDSEGCKYTASLEAFCQDLPPEIQALVAKRTARATRGTHQLVAQTRELAAQPHPNSKDWKVGTAPIIIPTDWGPIDVTTRVYYLATATDRLLKATEMELYRKEGLDIYPLLKPGVPGPLDHELTRELESNDMMLLLERNCQDLAAWYAKQTAHVDGKPSPQQLEEEATLSERVRRRLLQLVQKAPPAALSFANIPTPAEIRKMHEGPKALSTNREPMAALQSIRRSVVALNAHDHKELNVLIKEEKDVMTKLQELAKEKVESAKYFAAWGAHEHDDIRDVTEKYRTLFDEQGSFHTVLIERYENYRVQLKEMRRREEALFASRKRVKDLQEKLKEAMKKQKPYETIKIEVATADRELTEAETDHEGTKRRNLKEAMHAQMDAWLEFGQKMTIFATYGKHLADQIPQGEKVRRDELPDYEGGPITTQITNDFFKVGRGEKRKQT
ncbi:hypothetical protein HKX48_009422 [Thoreauomyces humboldtii]|nr:hypothetical protein HKX48_009422 [Thoreauomyces humboldtii]